jgi:hypothetical protein
MPPVRICGGGYGKPSIPTPTLDTRDRRDDSVHQVAAVEMTWDIPADLDQDAKRHLERLGEDVGLGCKEVRLFAPIGAENRTPRSRRENVRETERAE